MADETPRTLGEMRVEELLKSAGSELSGLSALINRLPPIEVDGDDQRKWINAYIGSIWGRVAVAEIKVQKL